MILCDRYNKGEEFKGDRCSMGDCPVYHVNRCCFECEEELTCDCVCVEGGDEL